MNSRVFNLCFTQTFSTLLSISFISNGNYLKDLPLVVYSERVEIELNQINYFLKARRFQNREKKIEIILIRFSRLNNVNS